MKVPRLKLKNLMALDVADAGVLKRNIVRLLLKHPQGIKYGDFSGAFYRLHGHHLQLALHGYSSLKYLLTHMKNMVVLEKDSQATVVKLANDVPFNQWLDDGEGWVSSEEGSGSSKEEMQSPRNEEAEDEAEPCSPAPLLDTGFTVSDSILQKMERKKFLATAVVPIFRILRDYPKGLDLRMLTETLKRRGFDLERLSQDVGYSDTMHCLLELPILCSTFFYGMVPQNCMVKLLSSSPRLPALRFSTGCSLHKPLSSSASSTFSQHLMKTKPASHRSMTSQASASPSCDLYQSLSKSKTWAQIVLGKKPASRSSTTSASKSKTLKQSVSRKKAAPAEVLELLTNLINTYKLGVTIQGLQEFLLRVMGFDLEKFSIAQGYKDTLEFLEDQMPELKVEYSKKRLKCVVKQGQDIRKKQKRYQHGRKKLTKSPEESLALLTNLLNTEKSGMRVKKLQELLLALAGFDMEKFCIAQGYVDTLGYLEHQMPELNITYRGNRLECVVKKGRGKRKKQKCQGSQEETTNRRSKRKEQKTYQVSQEEMKETLAEVLALLTMLLKTYTSRLWVKKLQEFLLTVEGFDLQRFTIAQGYKDILEFLEHQMPELNITYCGNRLECIFKKGQGKRKEQKTYQVSQKETTETLAEVLAFLTKLLKTYISRPQIKKLQEFLLTVEGFDLQKLTIAQDCKDILEFLEHQMPELNITYCGNKLKCVVKKGQIKRKKQKKSQGSQEEMTEKGQDSQTEIAEQTMEILETQSRANNLLFKGISEDFGRQNLEEKFRELLQDYLKIQGDFLDFDKIFRVNSGLAFKKKLPRDILVCFTHKRTGDAILKKHRESPFKVAGKEVQIFQDLPTSVLRKRKDFYFLRQILQEKGIRYHWKIPFAIDVNLPKGRKVIKKVEQAKLLAEELQVEELKKKSSSKP